VNGYAVVLAQPAEAELVRASEASLVFIAN